MAPGVLGEHKPRELMSLYHQLFLFSSLTLSLPAFFASETLVVNRVNKTCPEVDCLRSLFEVLLDLFQFFMFVYTVQ